MISLSLSCGAGASVFKHLTKRPTQIMLAAGALAHGLSWRYAHKSRNIVPLGLASPKNKKLSEQKIEQARAREIDPVYEKCKHECIKEVSAAFGSALWLFAANYIVMAQCAELKKLPPFTKRTAVRAFGGILLGCSGVQFFLLPYGICKFLILSPEWVRFLEDPEGKVRLKDRLRKMIANKINKKEDAKIVKLAARLAHAALMKDLDIDAKNIEAIAHKRARHYYWCMVLFLECALLSAAYIACA